MKKLLFYAAIVIVAVAFVGCKDTQTPQTDSTKLWPARSASDEYWGYIDAKGNMVIAPIYQFASHFSCGYAVVLLPNGSTPVFIDTKGKMQQATIDDTDDFYYKYALVELNGLYGFINTSFEFSCLPYYYNLRHMSENGLAAAKLTSTDKWGYINAKGENKISPVFDYADYFENGVAIVKIGEKCGAINTNGDFVLQPTYKNLIAKGDGLIAFIMNSKMGLMNANGDIAAQPIYDDLGDLADDNLIPACRNDKWGYINKNGEEKLAFIYGACSSFYEGYAAVYSNEVERLIDTKGNVIMTLPENETFYTLMRNGLILVRSCLDNGNYVYKYVDIHNNIVYQWTVDTSLWNAPEKKPVSRQDRMRNLVEQTIHFDSRNL